MVPDVRPNATAGASAASGASTKYEMSPVIARNSVTPPLSHAGGCGRASSDANPAQIITTASIRPDWLVK